MVSIMFLATPTPHAFSRQQRSGTEHLYLFHYIAGLISESVTQLLSHNEIKRGTYVNATTTPYLWTFIE